MVSYLLLISKGYSGKTDQGIVPLIHAYIRLYHFTNYDQGFQKFLSMYSWHLLKVNAGKFHWIFYLFFFFLFSKYKLCSESKVSICPAHSCAQCELTTLSGPAHMRRSWNKEDIFSKWKLKRRHLFIPIIQGYLCLEHSVKSFWDTATRRHPYSNHIQIQNEIREGEIKKN